MSIRRLRKGTPQLTVYMYNGRLKLSCRFLNVIPMFSRSASLLCYSNTYAHERSYCDVKCLKDGWGSSLSVSAQLKGSLMTSAATLLFVKTAHNVWLNRFSAHLSDHTFRL